MVNTKEELLNLSVNDIGNVRIWEDEILKWFDLLDAAWVHSGDPKDPHAELTSGYCSNGFFDCLRVLKYVNLSEILARELAERLKNAMGPFELRKVKWVIGSPMAAITFAHDVAKFAGIPINMFVEKDPADPKGKRMLWKRMAIPEEEPVLQIEELITTSHTTNEVERAIRDGNPNPVNFVPFIGVLVHRPPKMVDEYGGRKVVALIEKEVWAVPPEECPLCKQGSKRLRPKTNWKELTGKV
jgi:orotate phosphoribosyltransferase